MTLPALKQLFATLPGPYALRIGQEYTPEMDYPRQEAFPEANHSGSNRDVYDDRAWHLAIYYVEQLAAYSRLIPGPDGFFKKLTASPLLVDSAAATDWSRLVVPATFRSLGLPEVMGLAALVVARALGERYVHVAANPERQLAKMLYQLEFEAVDLPITVNVHPGISFSLQLHTCDLHSLSYLPEERLANTWHQLGMASMSPKNLA